MAAEVGELLEARGSGDQVADLLLEALVHPAAGGGVHGGDARSAPAASSSTSAVWATSRSLGAPPEPVDRLLDAVDRQLAVQVGDLVGCAHCPASLSIRR